MLKLFCAFHWTTIIARFVFVYNNLDPDQREFRLGWDHLNRFCSFFNLEQRFRIELRQYYVRACRYGHRRASRRAVPHSPTAFPFARLPAAVPHAHLARHVPLAIPDGRRRVGAPTTRHACSCDAQLERADEVKAKSRRKVMNKFSPHLAEEVVWELDKQWLVRVPCFSLVAERVRGEQLRFLVKARAATDTSPCCSLPRPSPRPTPHASLASPRTGPPPSPPRPTTRTSIADRPAMPPREKPLASEGRLAGPTPRCTHR